LYVKQKKKRNWKKKRNKARSISTEDFGDLFSGHQRKISRNPITFLSRGNNNLVVLLRAVSSLWQDGIGHLREERKLVQLPPRGHGALLRRGLVLGVNGFGEGGDAVAADFGDDGTGLGGDLLHVGGNVAVQLANLAIGVFEELDGDEMEPVVHRSHHGLHGVLHCVNAGLQRTGAFLGVGVEDGATHESLKSCELHEFEVLEFLLFFSLILQDSIKFKTLNKPHRKWNLLIFKIQ